MKTLFYLAWVLFVTLTATAQSSMEGMPDFTLTNDVYSAIGSGVNRSFGWTFQPLTDIDVTALGAFDYVVPVNGEIEVGLWNASGVLLASESITASSTSNNQSLYQSTTPLLLDAGQTYYLAAFSPAGSSQSFQFYVAGPDSDTGYATMSPEIQLGSIAYSPNAGFAFPSTLTGPGDSIVAPNFEFQVVPEPSTYGLIVGGIMIFTVIQKRRSFLE